ARGETPGGHVGSAHGGRPEPRRGRPWGCSGGGRLLPLLRRGDGISGVSPARRAASAGWGRVGRIPESHRSRTGGEPAVPTVAAGELLAAADAARGQGPLELMEAFARPFAFRSLCEVFEVREEERSALYEPVALLADKAGCSASAVEESVARIDAFVRGEMAR